MAGRVPKRKNQRPYAYWKLMLAVLLAPIDLGFYPPLRPHAFMTNYPKVRLRSPFRLFAQGNALAVR
jgi:hypothetical protein